MKKRWLFSKLESREDALKLVEDTSNAFLLAVVLQAASAYWTGLSILLDAVAYAVGAFCLRRFNSRAAAVVLLALAVGTGAIATSRPGATPGGGFVLAIFMLWSAVRAVEATFKLRSKFAQNTTSEQPGN